MKLGDDVDSTTKNIFSVDSTKIDMFPLNVLYHDMVSQLRCPKCNEYWKIKGIKICQEGHSICHSCGEHFSHNATCTAQHLSVRNIALENIVQTAIYWCPFAVPVGHRCCIWSGIPSDMTDHIRDKHYTEMVTGTGEDEWIRLSLSLDSSFQKAIFTLDQLFFPLSSIWEKELYFSVFHVGRKDDPNSYRYDFRMQNSDDPQQTHSETGNLCRNYLDMPEVVKSSYSISLNYDSIRRYVRDRNAVSCDIKIKRTDTEKDVEMLETMANETQPAESSENIPEDNCCP